MSSAPWTTLEPAVLRSLIYRFIAAGEPYPPNTGVGLARARYQSVYIWDMLEDAGLLITGPGIPSHNPTFTAANTQGVRWQYCAGCRVLHTSIWPPVVFPIAPVCHACATPSTFIRQPPTSFSALVPYWYDERKEELAQVLRRHASHIHKPHW